MPIESINPATGDLIERFEEVDDHGVEKILDRATKTFYRHRKLSFDQRAQRMNAAAKILEDEKESWGRIATKEMGKTLRSAVAEIEKCAWACRFYAEHAERMLADEPVQTSASRSFVRHLPIGPVLAVMPWNFPFWQVFRFAAPALMAGNVGLLKHASNVPRSALAIEEIFHRAGFEEGTFSTLLISSGKVSRVLRDPRVRAATLTGSEAAGRAVGSTAGECIKHSVLELGGSDPFIIMPSADLDKAVQAAVQGRIINNGQSCIAAKRFIVHQDIHAEFTDKFVAAFESLKVDDPMQDSTDVGPLATSQIRGELHQQVQRTLEIGGSRLVGAELLDGRGFFYRPGILADVPEGSPGYSEEIFGPVAILLSARDLDEAIHIGNATTFGLGSAIWTHEQEEIEKAANELDAGATFVNSIVASDPRLPFGGVKNSGYGRELSTDGIREFVNRKTVSVA